MNNFKIHSNSNITNINLIKLLSNLNQNNKNFIEVSSISSSESIPSKGNMIFSIAGTLYYRSNDNTFTVLGIN